MLLSFLLRYFQFTNSTLPKPDSCLSTVVPSSSIARPKLGELRNGTWLTCWQRQQRKDRARFHIPFARQNLSPPNLLVDAVATNDGFYSVAVHLHSTSLVPTWQLIVVGVVIGGCVGIACTHASLTCRIHESFFRENLLFTDSRMFSPSKGNVSPSLKTPHTKPHFICDNSNPNSSYAKLISTFCYACDSEASTTFQKVIIQASNNWKLKKT